MARRLVIVSNRLPLTTDIVGGDIVLSPASGGRTARALAILLDYDGTLVPIVRTPDQAAPDPGLLPLLASLAGGQTRWCTS